MSFVKLQPLTKQAFAPFGDILSVEEAAESYLINNGNCRRHHALTKTDVAQEGGETIISIFRAKPFTLPVTISMMERHPLGSQAFMPLNAGKWIAVVAEDDGGKPGAFHAFLAQANQGIQYARNVWHLPLSPLEAEADFLVVDRAGPGNNLEEYYLPQPVIIEA